MNHVRESRARKFSRSGPFVNKGARCSCSDHPTAAFVCASSFLPSSLFVAQCPRHDESQPVLVEQQLCALVGLGGSR